MRKNRFQKVFLALLGLLLLNPCLKAQEEREYIRKGNRLYKKSEFAGSEGMYRRALTQDKPAVDGGFNLGDALYKQGRYNEAADEFRRATSSSSDDKEKQAESLYNLGNSLLKEQKFSESIEAYINSLMLKPENMEAKYNLAYAQDQLKKQEEQQQQNQDQDKQDNKDDNKSDQNKPEEQKNEDEKQDQQQQNQQQSISREDAQRLLDALAASEKKTQEKVQNEKAAKAKVRVIKNW
ncbi:MAG: tetratricopeptide repeat protein [Bacteroidales bacterium]|jgi:tetratricopeptide (TPR) repeat protein|nr:tetratricopeptide repeat protein [Bacteroidales bacterium]